MVNFLTYDSCEVFPGPRLNVLLGPNGTGKSTVTHAICLACGGSPATLGRSPDLKEFVKQGKEGEDCFVEVDILNSSKVTTQESILTLRRTISSSSKSSKWLWNGSPSSEKKIKELMVEMGIDMDNLCSFMPQDKVGNFSRQTPQGILQKTLQGIVIEEGGDRKSYYDIQKELSEHENNKLSKEQELDAKRKSRDAVANQLQAMQAEVDRMDNRRQAEIKVDLYESKLAVVEFKNACDALETAKEEAVEADRRLADAKDAIQPLEDAERQWKIKKTAVSNLEEDRRKKQEKLEGQLASNQEKVEQVDLDIAGILNEIAGQDAVRQTNEALREKYLASVAKDNRELEQAQSMLPELRDRIQQVSTTLQHKNQEAQSKQDQLQELQAHQRLQVDSIDTNLRELANFRDATQIFRQKLVEWGNERRFGGGVKFHEIARAMEWIEKNRDRFRGEVVGPVAMHIRVFDEACVPMLEKVIPTDKLFCFVATDENDGTFLKQNLRRQMKLSVDVITMLHCDTKPNPYSAEFLESLRGFGMQGYLSEQMACPDLIRSFLYTFTPLQSVLWSKVPDRGALFEATSERNLKRLIIPEIGKMSFSTYFQIGAAGASRGGARQESYEIVQYEGVTSRYGNRDLSISHVTVRPKNFLGKSAGEGVNNQKAALEAQIAAKRAELARTEGSLQKCRDDARDAQAEVSRLKEERNKLQKLTSLPTEIRRRLDTTASRLQEVEKKLNTDLAAAKAKLFATYRSSVKELLQWVGRSTKTFTDCNALTIELAVIERHKAIVGTKLSEASEALRDARAGLLEFQEAVRTARKFRDDCQRKSVAKERELTEIVNSKGGEAAFEAYYEDVKASCPEETVDEITKRIVHFQTELDSIVDNPQILARHAELTATLAQKESELRGLEQSFANIEHALQDRLRVWLENVREIVRKLNLSFGQFMEALQYRGEVHLQQTGKLLDYAVAMKVGFRVDAPMTELSGALHSGGERAVSTIMYLMALQQLTSAPFRVVDEINQGMDERNERLVFDRIVQTCCQQEASPQYFLVSPKLLQGLRSLENDSVTVLLVFNGPGVDMNMPTLSWFLSTLRGEASHNGSMKRPGSSDDGYDTPLTDDLEVGPKRRKKMISTKAAKAADSIPCKQEENSENPSKVLSKKSASSKVVKKERVIADEKDDGVLEPSVNVGKPRKSSSKKESIATVKREAPQEVSVTSNAGSAAVDLSDVHHLSRQANSSTHHSSRKVTEVFVVD